MLNASAASQRLPNTLIAERPLKIARELVAKLGITGHAAQSPCCCCSEEVIA